MDAYAIAIFGAGLVVIASLWAARAYFHSRGPRLVTCPQSGRAAAVQLAAGPAVLKAVFGRPSLLLRACSQWRGRRDCAQACLRQIEAAPEACLVRNVLAKWYEGKTCAFCGRRFGAIAWHQHKPCLIGPELRIHQWTDVQPEEVPGLLETCDPVCWTCNVAETHTW